MPPRPKAVPIVSGFLFAASAIAVIVGQALLFPNALLDVMWKWNRPGASFFQAMGRLAGIPLLALSVATFFAALGLRRRKRWAWWFAVVLFTVDGIGDIVSSFFTRDWLKSAAGVLVSSTFLWSLLARPVRLYFQQPSE